MKRVRDLAWTTRALTGVVAAIGLAACGGSDGDSSSDTTADASTATTPGGPTSAAPGAPTTAPTADVATTDSSAAAPTTEPSTTTPAPVETAAPTVDTPTTGPTTTAAATADTLAEVVYEQPTAYAAGSGVFTIEVPPDWTMVDTSKPDEAIVTWTDQTGNSAIVVNIFEEATPQTDDELVERLQAFLTGLFENEPGFSINAPKPQSDGSILLVFSYDVDGNGVLGNSFVEQRGNKVSILTTFVPEDQFDALLPLTDTIINTYRIDPSKPATS